MLHMAFVLGMSLAGGIVGWTLGWLIDEIEEALDVRRKQRRERALLAMRQGRAMRTIDRITTAAVAEMVRIARDGRPDA